MSEAALLSREVGPVVPCRCAIGHVVKAALVTATYQHRDMDDEPMTPFTMQEYEPPTCVVCGLIVLKSA